MLIQCYPRYHSFEFVSVNNIIEGKLIPEAELSNIEFMVCQYLKDCQDELVRVRENTEMGLTRPSKLNLKTQPWDWVSTDTMWYKRNNSQEKGRKGCKIEQLDIWQAHEDSQHICHLPGSLCTYNPTSTLALFSIRIINSNWVVWIVTSQRRPFQGRFIIERLANFWAWDIWQSGGWNLYDRKAPYPTCISLGKK